jgi:hypothetical protein
MLSIVFSSALQKLSGSPDRLFVGSEAGTEFINTLSPQMQDCNLHVATTTERNNEEVKDDDEREVETSPHAGTHANVLIKMLLLNAPIATVQTTTDNDATTSDSGPCSSNPCPAEQTCVVQAIECARPHCVRSKYSCVDTNDGGEQTADGW